MGRAGVSILLLCKGYLLLKPQKCVYIKLEGFLPDHVAVDGRVSQITVLFVWFPYKEGLNNCSEFISVYLFSVSLLYMQFELTTSNRHFLKSLHWQRLRGSSTGLVFIKKHPCARTSWLMCKLSKAVIAFVPTTASCVRSKYLLPATACLCCIDTEIMNRVDQSSYAHFMAQFAFVWLHFTIWLWKAYDRMFPALLKGLRRSFVLFDDLVLQTSCLNVRHSLLFGHSECERSP